MKSILYKIDGTKTPVAPANGKEFSLQEMYDLIGCNIVEVVQGQDGDVPGELWCDEEALLKSDAVMNIHATNLYRAAHPGIDYRELGIFGNALFVPTTSA